MYCGNCGHKIIEGSTYCDNCGYKLENIKEVHCQSSITKENINHKLKELRHNKYTKAIITLLIIAILYNTINFMFFSENRVIKQYVKAYANNDYETLIKLSNIDKNEFVNDKVITDKYGTKTNDYVHINILSQNNSSKEHPRTVEFSTINQDKTIMNLTIKKAGHKFLIFNKYVITSSDLTAQDVNVTTSPDVKVKIDGVSLTDKYKQEETNDKITYQIPFLLKKNVKMEITLNNGVTVTNTKNVYSYEELTTAKLYNATLDNNTNKKINSELKNTLKSIVNSALTNKSIDEVKKDTELTSNISDLTVFEDDYNTLKLKYQNKEVKDFKIDDIKIMQIDIADDNKIDIKVKVSYSYKDKTNRTRSTTRSINASFENDTQFLIDNIYLSNLYTFF